MSLWKKSAPEPVDERPEILVVEDDEMQALYLQTVLGHHNYRVTLAEDGQAALETLQKRAPALVISDIVMPRMDGYDLCQNIKENPATRDIPVVLMTSLASSNDAVRGLYCGADSLLAKPFDDRFLLSRVESMIASARARTQAQQAQQTQGQTHSDNGGASPDAEAGIRVSISGKKYFVTRERLQTIDLLLASFETATQKNQELLQVREQLAERDAELKEARETIQRLNEELRHSGELGDADAHHIS
jgi:two-component system cell cycle response regulator